MAKIIQLTGKFFSSNFSRGIAAGQVSTVAQFDKVDFPVENIERWKHLGQFASHIGCARACMKAAGACKVYYCSTSNTNR